MDKKNFIIDIIIDLILLFSYQMIFVTFLRIALKTMLKLITKYSIIKTVKTTLGKLL